MYVYKSKIKRFFAGVLDFLGMLFCFWLRKDRPLSWKHILVIRIDHIGDIVLAEPFLAELRRLKPHSKITFLTTSQGNDIYKKYGKIDHLVVFDPFWFSKKKSFFSFFKKWIDLIAVIRNIEADVVIDLRGDMRHIAAARLAKPFSWLLSRGGTGGGFLLSRCVKPIHAHASLQNLNLLRDCGGDVNMTDLPTLSPELSSSPYEYKVIQRASSRMAKGEDARGSKPLAAIHLGSGTPAKRWPLAHWRELLTKIKDRFDIYYIGDSALDDIAEEMADRYGGVNLCAKIPLSALGTFLKTCDLLISSDSGPVHIAAAHDVPTVDLFSGTNEADIWRPMNPRTAVLRHDVSCSPCHLKSCPLPRHQCMEGITPDAVAAVLTMKF
jgi:ADP-heptose:LPS heptosyltransferase